MLKSVTLFLFALVFLKLLFAVSLPLAGDEAYYWLWSQDLDWSYYDHAPMTAYWIRGSVALLGKSELAVRLPAILSGVIIAFLLYSMARDWLKSDHLAFLYLISMATLFIFSLGSELMTPDAPLALFWVLAFYGLWQLLKSGRRGWWYLIGFAVGGGLLSKYVMLLFGLVLIAMFIFSEKMRNELRHKEPYISGVIAILLFSPVVYWNATHDWISFKFQLSHGLGERQDPWWQTVGEYLGGQVALMTPLFLIPAVLFLRRFPDLLRRRDELGLLCWTTSVIPLSFFFLTSFLSPVEANWPAVAHFSTLLCAFSFFREKEGSRGWKRYLKVAIGCSVCVTLFGHLHLLSPKLPIGQRAILRQFYGWKEMGVKLDETIAELKPYCTGDLLIYAKRYQVASELNFYSRSGVRVYELQEGKDAHQFGLWERPIPVSPMGFPQSIPLGGEAGTTFWGKSAGGESCVIALLKEDEGAEQLPQWLRGWRLKFAPREWIIDKQGRTAQHVRLFLFTRK